MRKKIYSILMILFVLILAACGSDETTAQSEEVDETPVDTAVETETANAPQPETNANIVATTVAIVEIADALELDLVGVPTSYKDLPERYDGVPEVGMAMAPDLEIIRSLQPDEVLTTTNLTEFVAEYYDGTEIPATYMDLDSIDSMYDEIERLGEKYDRVEQANALVLDFENKIAEIEATLDGVDSPKVLILLGVPGSYLVVTENAYVGDLVARAGGTNAVDEPELDRVAANTEMLQQADADIILRMAHGMPDEVVDMFDQEFATNDIWQHFRAVQEGRVYDLEEELFGTTANLAAVEALDQLIEILYGDTLE